MKKMLPSLFGTALLSSVLFCCEFAGEKHTGVSINEVCSGNKTIIRDGVHDGADYIELYNSSDAAISLDGWFLSDDEKELKKYEIEDVVIEPHGYAVFYSIETTARDNSRLNFKIKSTGEKIFLTDREGKTADTVYVPYLPADTAYARSADGKRSWESCAATPGASNNAARRIPEIVLDEPVFSHRSGFYDEEFLLTIRGKGKIYYTTDGSEPTEDSLLYTDGISIKNGSPNPNVLNAIPNVVADWKDYQPPQEPADKAVVIRAAAFDGKGGRSPIVTASYFVGMEQYRRKNVISIVTEPEKLIGDEGIFVTGKDYDEVYLAHEMSKDGVFSDGWTDHLELANFSRRGRSWEVPADVSLFFEGEHYLSQKTGVRVNGNYSRTYPVKDLRLVAREDYSGSDFWKKQIFPGIDSRALLLVSVPQKIYFTELAEGRSVGYQRVIDDCPVFVNGEYWYTAGLMERYDEHYIAQKYNVSADNVLLIKDEEAEAGERYFELYEELIGLVQDESMENEEICEKLYELFDMQSFIDWICYHLYLQNDDVSFLHNTYLWRTAKQEDGVYGDGKWRWLIYDTDHAAPGADAEQMPFYQYLLLGFNKPYQILKENEQFCRQFVLGFQDMANTSFAPENVEKKLAKFGLDLTYADSFFIRRRETAMKDLAREFSLEGALAAVELSVNETEGGYLVVNSAVLPMETGTWTGTYFTDYPITVKAVAKPGWHFDGWEGADEEDETLEVKLTEDGVSLKALFSR